MAVFPPKAGASANSATSAYGEYITAPLRRPRSDRDRKACIAYPVSSTLFRMNGNCACRLPIVLLGSAHSGKSRRFKSWHFVLSADHQLVKVWASAHLADRH